MPPQKIFFLQKFVEKSESCGRAASPSQTPNLLHFMFQLAQLESCHRDYHNRRKRGEKNNGATAKNLRCASPRARLYLSGKQILRRKKAGQHSQLQFSLEEPEPLGSGDSGVMPEMTVAVDTEQITDSARSASCSPPPL